MPHILGNAYTSGYMTVIINLTNKLYTMAVT